MLRFRLFLGFLPLLAILAAVGLYATWLVSRVVGETEGVFLRNYRSAVAAQEMKEAVWRMDRAVLHALDGQSEQGELVFKPNVDSFERGLIIQRENTRSEDERLLLKQMEIGFTNYRSAGETIFSMTNDVERQKTYGSQFWPRQTILLGQATKIQKASDEAMAQAHAKMFAARKQSAWFMLAALITALVVAGYAAYQSGRLILQPIKSLTQSVNEVGRGHLDQRVPEVWHDELGALAHAFNRMAAQLQTARERLSERIMRLHRSREATLATFPDPIFVLDSDGQIELTNPAADELSRRLGLGNGMLTDLEPRIRRALKDGDSYLPTHFKDALSIQGKSGERHYLPRVLAMHNPTGGTVGVAVVLLDITRFRLMDDVKTDLVATVSHELKTPLTSIVMVLHLLAEKTIGPLTPKQLELVETASTDAERLQRILSDLLDLARLESEAGELRLESVTAEELIGQTLRENREHVTAHGLKLAVEVEPGLPAVEVDTHRLGHVFSNFISNAVKHSPKGGTITLRAHRNAAGALRFGVADEGPGIPEEFQGRIFEKFFRVPGQHKSGAGLGLSIAREIVMAHGGRIGVESEPGRGAEFYAELRPPG